MNHVEMFSYYEIDVDGQKNVRFHIFPEYVWTFVTIIRKV